jgi:hypothetical protein
MDSFAVRVPLDLIPYFTQHPAIVFPHLWAFFSAGCFVAGATVAAGATVVAGATVIAATGPLFFARIVRSI